MEWPMASLVAWLMQSLQAMNWKNADCSGVVVEGCVSSMPC